MQKFRAYILPALFLLGLAAYYFSPLTEDIYVFLGAARLADMQYGGGLQAALDSWELKPFANRIFIWLLNEASLHNGLGPRLFLFNFKTIYLLLILTAALNTTVALKRISRPLTYSVKDLFLLIASLLLFHSFRCFMQAEFTAVLFCLCALPFLLSGKKFLVLTGCLLLAIVPWFKILTALFVLQVFILLCAFWGRTIRELLLPALITFSLSLSMVLIVQLFHPAEINDILEASMFQSSFAGIRWQILPGLLIHTFWNFAFFPLLPLSLILFVPNLRNSADPKIRIALLLCWLSGFALILLQHRFYVYHFVLLFFPILFSLLEFSFQHRLRTGHKVLFATSFAIFLLFNTMAQCILPASIFHAARFPNYLYDWSWSGMQQALEEQSRLQTTFIHASRGTPPDEPVLYLEEGLAPYFIHRPSASRYFFPMPVQRAFHNPALMKRESFTRTLEEINRYSGKFIVLNTNWFNPDLIPRMEVLKEKLRHYRQEKITSTLSLYVRE